MAVRGLGFQDAVSLLEPYANVPSTSPARKPEIKQRQVQPTENEPFNSTYSGLAATPMANALGI
jgi:hypothetical protein